MNRSVKIESTPIISVIVPVFNAENYLRKCIDSLLSQTFSKFEILLIDDGSTDKSGQICDEYARVDKRVLVFHNENQGVSATRQFGIDHASGIYTIHVDSDDWVDCDMLEELYAEAQRSNADMVICDYWVEYERKTELKKQQPTCLDAESVLRDLFVKLHGSCCNKLIRKSCYTDYHIQFPKDIHYSEDLYVMVALLLHPLKISYLPKAFYHYDQTGNVNSISRSATRLTYEWFRAASDEIIKLLSSERFSDEISIIKNNMAFMALRTNYYTPVEFRSRFAAVLQNCKLKGWKKYVVLGAFRVNYNLFRTVLQMLYWVRSVLIGVGK